MKDKGELKFNEGDEVLASDGINFWGKDGTKSIKFEISELALQDYFGNPSRIELLKAFKGHRPSIEAKARSKYQAGVFEKDNYILIRTEDFDGSISI